MQQNIVFVCALSFAVALGENISVNLLSNEFTNAVDGIEKPKKIAANVPTAEFAREFTYATANLLNDLILEYYRQARLAGIILANDWKSSTTKLLKKASQVPENKLEYLEPYLKKVLGYMNDFFLMKPGISNSNWTASLSEIPTDFGVIKTHFENFEPVDLFNNLGLLVDRDLSAIHILANQIFVTGWQGARLALAKVQQQFRDAFLHCKLLTMWIEETNKIDGSSEILQRNVRPESWKQYEQLNERLKLIGRTVRYDRKFCQNRL